MGRTLKVAELLVHSRKAMTNAGWFLEMQTVGRSVAMSQSRELQNATQYGE